MKTEKQLTAVEWLEEKIKEYAIDLDILNYFEQAKDIELKNLLSAQSEAYLRGYNDGQKYNN
jgi:hypothetical protein